MTKELTREKGSRESERSDPSRPKQEPRFVSQSAAVKQHQAGILCLVRRLLDASRTTGGSSVRGVSKGPRNLHEINGSIYFSSVARLNPFLKSREIT